MGKKAKEHRKRVKKHTDWIKHQRRVADQLLKDIIAIKQEEQQKAIQQHSQQQSPWSTAKVLTK